MDEIQINNIKKYPDYDHKLQKDIEVYKAPKIFY